tara:strand:+ start:2059 stop:2637 length:579 start_codon:yes stop_codon:yes gene_type:complete
VGSNEVNIFYLHHDPRICAEMHNDKHCIKMILEYAQLLSTAHRVLDGTIERGTSKSGRQKSIYRLSDNRDNILYSATHIHHPSAVWVRQSVGNYMWLSDLLVELCKEYTYRYGKVHKCERDGLVQLLHDMVPDNMNVIAFTEPTPAMPDDVKIAGDSLASYRNYYISNKQHLASWKGKVNSRTIPEWFNANL